MRRSTSADPRGKYGGDYLGLSRVRFDGGVGSLASWGSIKIDGKAATLALNNAADLELPGAVADDVTTSVVLLDDAAATLAMLPVSSTFMAVYDLRVGERIGELEPIRDASSDMPFGLWVTAPDGGAVFQTDGCLVRLASGLTGAPMRGATCANTASRSTRRR
jgi:hypothetical protein